MTSHVIETQSELDAFCQSIKGQPWMAIDTEFVRTDTYFPILCLIQIQSSEGQQALIDPLAIEEMDSLWDLLRSPDMLKVFHSARQDMEVLYYAMGDLPQAIVDTQIACVFLHHGDLAGLARVVKAELDVELEKDQTRTNWQQRPLTDKQLQYALDDVRYLAPLYQQLLQHVTQPQWQALQQDFDALIDESLYRTLPEEAGLRLKAAKNLGRKNQAIAYRLAAWREVFAIEENKPRRWVLSDDALISIAKRPPKTVDALYKVPNIKASSVKQYGEEWIDEVDYVFAHPEEWPEKTTKPDPVSAQEDVLITLGFAVLQQTALDFGINANNLASKNDLMCMLRQDTPCLIGWRHLLLEQPLRALWNQQHQLRVQQGQLQFSESNSAV